MKGTNGSFTKIKNRAEAQVAQSQREAAAVYAQGRNRVLVLCQIQRNESLKYYAIRLH